MVPWNCDRVGCLDDFIYLIENLITGCLIEVLLVVEIEEIMDVLWFWL
jgi:hypothetical protein